MKRLLFLTGSVVLVLLAVVAARTASYRAPEAPVPPSAAVPVDAGAAGRLAGAVRIPTISHEDPAAFDAAAFSALHDYLRDAFPLAHRTLRREVVARHSLLFSWPGSDPALDPLLLMGHLDVVPVEPGSEASWEEEPFGGTISGGFVWGRGAIDNKATVVGTLEAVESLLREGFRPRRTVLLAFGHDEEVGGVNGARAIAALLRGRGVRLEMVLDEGGVIGEGLLPGIEAPTALVGVAEKGFLTVELAARTEGGHSSLPPRQSAVGIVSAAVARLEASPMPARLDGPTRAMFDRVGPRLPLPERAIFANLWLTRPLVLRRLQESPTTNAMVRTTAAATMFRAGTKENVLPSSARAAVNFRIHPGDDIAGVLAHVRRVVDDRRVRVRPVGAFSAEPSRVSSADAGSFRALERAVRSVVPDAVVAPYLVVVVTDSRHFEDLARGVYRLLPLRLGPDDLPRMHGANERVSVDGYAQAIRVYRALIREVAG